MIPAVLASCSPSPEQQGTLSERLPPPVAARVRATVPRPDELAVLSAGTEVVRAHSLGGPHPSAWDAMRDWGPTKSRFDHHTPPHRAQRRAIAYLAWGRTLSPLRSPSTSRTIAVQGSDPSTW